MQTCVMIVEREQQLSQSVVDATDATETLNEVSSGATGNGERQCPCDLKRLFVLIVSCGWF